MKRLLILSIVIVSIIALSSMLLNHPRFGENPKNERLERVKKSLNYQNGEFVNLEPTYVMSPDKSQLEIMYEFIIKKNKRVRPDHIIPSIKSDIRAIDPKDNVLIWFGHSSYFMQIEGKTFLIDPVLSDYAAPFSFLNKAFIGSSLYHAEDLPEIDYLIITHDHWDHLDYPSVMALKPKIKKIICALGVGQHFENWKFDTSFTTELDWFESLNLDANWSITATPARHFSGRMFKRNQTLWASFVLQTPELKLYLGGDSGYGSHFEIIGEKYGPFDLAILEQGQYDKNWDQIHLMPQDLQKVASELKTKRILPVHNSKFALANHPWNEPLNKLQEYTKESYIPVITPQIGEMVSLNDHSQVFKKWWKAN